MLKILKNIFALIAAFLAIYTLITDNELTRSIMFFFLGLSFLITGYFEFQEKKKELSYYTFSAAIFIIFVSIVILF